VALEAVGVAEPGSAEPQTRACITKTAAGMTPPWGSFAKTTVWMTPARAGMAPTVGGVAPPRGCGAPTSAGVMLAGGRLSCASN